MKHLFVPYKIAKQLKEKGFNEPCFLVYHDKKLLKLVSHVASNFMISTTTNKELGVNTFTAPLYQQVIDWFREKHHIHIQNDSLSYTISGNSFKTIQSGIVYRSYYEALTKAIEAALNLIA